jgi:hypothetical protein
VRSHNPPALSRRDQAALVAQQFADRETERGDSDRHRKCECDSEKCKRVTRRERIAELCEPAVTQSVQVVLLCCKIASTAGV